MAECGVSLVSSIGVSFLQPSMRDGEKGERGREGRREGGEEGEREGRRERGEERERGGGEGRRVDYKSLGVGLHLSLSPALCPHECGCWFNNSSTTSVRLLIAL